MKTIVKTFICSAVASFGFCNVNAAPADQEPSGPYATFPAPPR
jgi:hypothetical protein